MKNDCNPFPHSDAYEAELTFQIIVAKRETQTISDATIFLHGYFKIRLL